MIKSPMAPTVRWDRSTRKAVFGTVPVFGMRREPSPENMRDAMLSTTKAANATRQAAGPENDLAAAGDLLTRCANHDMLAKRHAALAEAHSRMMVDDVTGLHRDAWHAHRTACKAHRRATNARMKRWITLKPHGKDEDAYVHVLIDDDGKILAGPAALEGRNVQRLGTHSPHGEPRDTKYPKEESHGTDYARPSGESATQAIGGGHGANGASPERRREHAGSGGGGTGSGGPSLPNGPNVITARDEHTRKPEQQRIDESIARYLSPDQRHGAELAIESMERTGGFLNADGTGIGKTRQILATADHYAKSGKKVLIVAPSEVLKNDFKKGTFAGSYADDANAMGLSPKLVRGEEGLAPGEVRMTTYGELKDMQRHVDKNTVVLFDEAHGLKNSSSQQGSAGMDIAKNSHATMFATATPADKPDHLNYLMRAGVFHGMKKDELFPQLGLINKSFYNPHTGREQSKWEINPKVGRAGFAKRLGVLFDSMTAKGAMIKRELSLEGVGVHSTDITLPPECHQKLNEIAREIAKTSRANAGLQRAATLLAQRHAQEPYKIPAAVDHVKQELAAGRSVVVFLGRVSDIEKEGGKTSIGTADALRKELAQHGITDVSEIHGGNGGKKQTLQAMNDFQSGKNRVVIATIESGGTGINLDDRTGDRPRTTIMMTPPLGATPYMQALGRTHRRSTRSLSKVVNLYGDTDVEQWNRGIIDSKLSSLHAITGSTQHGQNSLTDLSGDEIAEMAAHRELERQQVADDRENRDLDSLRDALRRSGVPRVANPTQSTMPQQSEHAAHLQQMGIRPEKVANYRHYINVSGNTYHNRHKISALGGEYNRYDKTWNVPVKQHGDAGTLERDLSRISGLRLRHVLHDRSTKHTVPMPSSKSWRPITKGWITLKPHGEDEDSYVHVFVGDDGKIAAGPKGMEGKTVGELKKTHSQHGPERAEKHPKESGAAAAAAGKQPHETPVAGARPSQEDIDKVTSENPDAITLFRVGSTYEAYGGQADKLRKLTGLSQLPHRDLEQHLRRIVATGQRVAIAEQGPERADKSPSFETPEEHQALQHEKVRSEAFGNDFDPEMAYQAMDRRGIAAHGKNSVKVVPHPAGGFAVEHHESIGGGQAYRNMLPEQHPDIDTAQRAALNHLQKLSTAKQADTEHPDSFAAAWNKHAHRGHELDIRNHALADYINAHGGNTSPSEIHNRFYNHHISALGPNSTNEHIRDAFVRSIRSSYHEPISLSTGPRSFGDVWTMKYQNKRTEEDRAKHLEQADHWEKDAAIARSLGEYEIADTLDANAKRARNAVEKNRKEFAEADEEEQRQKQQQEAEEESRHHWRTGPSGATPLTPKAMAAKFETRYSAFGKLLADTGWYSDSTFAFKAPEKLKRQILDNTKGDITQGKNPDLQSLVNSADQQNNRKPMMIVGHKTNPGGTNGRKKEPDFHTTLLADSDGNYSYVNSKTLVTIQKYYPNATFHAANRKDGPIAVRNNGEIVGLLMPLGGDTHSKFDKIDEEAVRAHTGARTVSRKSMLWSLL